jgi:hypothetical protein
MTTGSRLVLTAAALVIGVLLPLELATQQAPDTILLKGPTFGGVTFSHIQHVDRGGCMACHHESKPELPATEEYGSCKSCHTLTVEPPLVTNARDAFHDRRARQGICVDCHTTEAANGKTPPARCTDCHKAEQG